ncbi:Anoctamin-7 [Phlyctochytrium bullatum]|nr:Anoctamin-7 [Phlyctochytrium bullatum]
MASSETALPDPTPSTTDRGLLSAIVSAAQDKLQPAVSQPPPKPDISLALAALKKTPGERTDAEEEAVLEYEAFGDDPAAKLGLDEDDERILTRRHGRSLVHFLFDDDAALFDEVKAWKDKDPSRDMDAALRQFSGRRFFDAVVKAVYLPANLHFDSVLKYDLPRPATGTDPETDAAHVLETQSRRAHFELELLRQGLVLIRERGLDSEAAERKEEDDVGAHFVKVLAPFEVLAREAQRCKLAVEVVSREKQMEGRVRGRVREKLAKARAQMSKLQRRVASRLSNIPSSSPATPPPAPDVKCRPLERRPFVPGPDNTLVGTLRFALGLVPHPVDTDLDDFRADLVHMFRPACDEAGNPLPADKLAVTFFSTMQRAFLVHQITLRTRIGAREGAAPVGVTDLLLAGVFVDFYPIHDGGYEPASDEEEEDGAHRPGAKVFVANARSRLYESWCRLRGSTFLLVPQPLGDVRAYFGEKVAFYFAWLGFYTVWLVPLVLAGVLTTVYSFADAFGRNAEAASLYTAFDNALTVPMAFVAAVWAGVVLRFWRRQEAVLRNVWGCEGVGRGREVIETRRAEWFGVMLRRSPVTEKIEPHFPAKARWAIFLMLGFQAAVITVSSIKINSYLSLGLSSLLTLLNILLVTPLYINLAYVLNKWENHKTVQQFEDALISKTFLFVFLQNFSNLLFHGILKPLLPSSLDSFRACELNPQGEPSRSCMGELMFSLAVIFGGLQFFAQAQNVVVPMIMQGVRRRHQDKMRERIVKATGRDAQKGQAAEAPVATEKVVAGEEAKVSSVTVVAEPVGTATGLAASPSASATASPETSPKHRSPRRRPKHSFHLPGTTKTTTFQTSHTSTLPQHLTDDLLDNWSDASEFQAKIVQFGFIAFFTPAFPLAPVLAFLGNCLEVRFGAYRLVTQSQRPFPLRARGVGAWVEVAHVVARIGVLVNALVVAFASGYFEEKYIGWVQPERRLGARLVFVVVFEQLVQMVVHFIDKLVPDVPGHIQSLIDRQHYLARLENDDEVEADDEVEFVENVAKGPVRFLLKKAY